MNYKEKYEQAIEALRSLFAEQAIKHCDRVNIKDITNIFSELKESEDEKIRKALIKLVKKAGEGYENVIDGVSIENAIAWLEKQGEQKPAWSEEDEQYITDTLNLLSFGCSTHSVGEVVDFLKSLKDRYTWKPSEKEMVALEHAINCYSGISPTNANEVFILEIMKDRLKKLKEE